MSLVDRPTRPARASDPRPELRLPAPRGPRSEHLLAHLPRRVHEVAPLPPAEDDPLEGQDTPLALHLLYELHYRGLPGVDERWEWNPSLLAMRAQVERELEDRLIAEVGPIPMG